MEYIVTSCDESPISRENILICHWNIFIADYSNRTDEAELWIYSMKPRIEIFNYVLYEDVII